MSENGWSGFIKALGKNLAQGNGLKSVKNETLLSDSEPASLMYPSDLFAHTHQAFIFFNIRGASLKEASPSSGSICLYMPSTLVARYGAHWSPVTFPLERVIEQGQQYYNLAKDIGSKIIDGQNPTDILKTIATNPAAQIATHNLIRKELNADYAAELRQAIGKAINPFAAVVYDVPEFRQFDFSFEFFAKNDKEAEEIRKIIKLFKLAMHPSRLGGDIMSRPDNSTADGQPLFWGFPYTFDVFLCTPWTDKMFMMKRSALTSMNVDYVGSGVQAFFKDGHPVHIKMDIKFQELELLTREDVEQNF